MTLWLPAASDGDTLRLRLRLGDRLVEFVDDMVVVVDDDTENVEDLDMSCVGLFD